MNVLVTGGAGYVGARLVPALLKAGHRVRVLDKLLFGAEALAACQDNIELIPGDVRTSPGTVMKGIEAVIHLAGVSNDPTAEYNPQANKSVNTDATIRLAQQAKEAGVRRFVFASSCSVYYSHNPDENMRHEDYPVDPQAPYSWSKRHAELGILPLADDHFHPVALRKGTVYGQSARMRYDLVVNTFTRDAFAKRCLTLHAGGRMWRPLLHIDDAVAGYLAVLQAPEKVISGQIFNMLSDNYQVLKVAHEVRRALEGSKGIRLDLNIQQVGVSRSYRVSGDKFSKTVGFEPRHEIGAAAGEMWDVLEEGCDVDKPIYYNIRWFELLTDMQRRLEAMGGSVF